MSKKVFITRQNKEKLNQLLPSERRKLAHKACYMGHLEDLENKLRRAEVVNEQEIPGDRITINCEITVTTEPGNIKDKIILVLPGDDSPNENNISVFSPLGVSLLGLKVGSSFNFYTGNKLESFCIQKVKIKPQKLSNPVDYSWNKPMVSEIFFS